MISCSYNKYATENIEKVAQKYSKMIYDILKPKKVALTFFDSRVPYFTKEKIFEAQKKKERVTIKINQNVSTIIITGIEQLISTETKMSF